MSEIISRLHSAIKLSKMPQVVFYIFSWHWMAMSVPQPDPMTKRPILDVLWSNAA